MVTASQELKGPVSQKATMPLADAERLASLLIERFAPACEHIEIAGSLRRRKAFIGDIELMLLPIFDVDPMTTTKPVYTALDALIRQALDERRYDPEADAELPIMIYDPTVKRDGPRYKRFRIASHGREISVDMFIADHFNFGNGLLIRTGDKDFSKGCLSRKCDGGLLPSGYHHDAGYLWRGSERIACPSEEEFFHILGLPVVPPAQRNREIIMRWKGEVPW